MGEWVEPEVWYGQLPAFYAAAALLTTDSDGRVLLVKPNYGDLWALPGGYVDAGEYPHDAAAREVLEELGLHVTPGPLLLVDWAPAAGRRPRAIVNFIFDGGTLDDARGIVLRMEELDAFAFVAAGEAVGRLPAAVAPRVPAALRARAEGCTAYLFGGTVRSAASSR